MDGIINDVDMTCLGVGGRYLSSPRRTEHQASRCPYSGAGWGPTCTTKLTQGRWNTGVPTPSLPTGAGRYKDANQIGAFGYVEWSGGERAQGSLDLGSIPSGSGPGINPAPPRRKLGLGASPSPHPTAENMPSTPQGSWRWRCIANQPGSFAEPVADPKPTVTTFGFVK
ncbi:hypothetical protein P167DRAFT_574405 [Morchella conica CCBAS932]|uniref:Uncharacterized protein n=1 Tax=Morchella conica CCBAS932 TaxID=1392247 RepID=A0A3N4KS71_9PEZI|nr:hypothetical protein P167DRAFT_574405 [Morchella conica CCBAS932]